MKKIAQIILAVVIVALVYVIYDQISTPIRFEQEMKAKKAQVIDRIKDIRTAQRAFKSKYQRFTGSFDTLTNFILQDTLELERKIVDEDDSVAMAQLKKMGKKNVEKFKIAKYGLTVAQITAAKRGEEIALPTGEVIPNAELTYRPYAPRSYAYLSDTNFSAKAATLAKGADLMYHEATYAAAEQKTAKERGHSTSADAAKAALKAGAKRLIIGHYSSRYKNENILVEEARAIFPETYPATEGVTFTIEKQR